MKVLSGDACMQVLNMSQNRIFGSIHSTLPLMPNLKHFNVSHNQLTGAIPGSLLTQPYLIDLDLSGNDFAVSDTSPWTNHHSFTSSACKAALGVKGYIAAGGLWTYGCPGFSLLCHIIT
jgi:hypothetical protein